MVRVLVLVVSGCGSVDVVATVVVKQWLVDIVSNNTISEVL
jgi:hypothetical protein